MRTPFPVLLLRSGTLRLLASKLHHQKHQGIRTDAEQGSNSGLIRVSEKTVLFGEESTHISPRVVLFLQIERLGIIRTSGILAERARRGGIGIQKVPGLLREEVGHIIAARLSWRSVKVHPLRRLAVHFDVPENFAQQTTNQVCEGVQVVHPISPEGLHLRVWDHHTTETDHTSTDEDRVHDCCEVFVGRIRGDGLADRGVQELIDCYCQLLLGMVWQNTYISSANTHDPRCWRRLESPR